MGKKKNESKQAEVKTDSDQEAQAYKGAMAIYKVLKLCPYVDENGNKAGELEVDTIHKMPTQLGDSLVEEGFLMKVKDCAEESEEVADEEVAPVEDNQVSTDKDKFVVGTYQGRTITSLVEDHTHHNGRTYKKFTVDGVQTMMVTPEEFEAGLSK